MVEWIAAIVAVISAAISTYFAWQARRFERENVSLAKLSWTSTYLDQVRSWASEACDCLSEASHLCELDPERTQNFFERRHAPRVRISSLIDRGRWFFPNDPSALLGQDNPSAFRGFRHATLDPLVGAYRALGRLNYQEGLANVAVREQIVIYKRDFVSKIHELIEPIHRSKRAEAYLAQIGQGGGTGD